MDRMKTPGSVACSDIRIRSPSRAPPEYGDDGSTASTPTRSSRRRSSETRALVEVDLPTPGEPVRPTMCAPPVRPPAYGASAAITSRSSGDPSSTWEIKRPIARASPSRARATSSSADSALRDTHDQCVALAAATAKCGRTGAAAAALELEREVKDDAGAGHADRVAERDRAAVDVDLVRGDAELLGRRDADGREGLVELDEVEVGGGDAFLLQCLGGRRCGLELQARVGAGNHGVRTDLGEVVETELLGLGLAHHDDGAGAVGDLRGRAGGDGAVLGDRAEAGERLDGGVGAEGRDGHRHDLLVEQAILLSRGRALVRLGREGVLLLTGEVVGRRVAGVGEADHRLLGELVVERVVGHRVDERGVAVLEAL